MKSIREIAEEIAEGVTNQEYHNRKLADRIEKALRNRDERAAKIAETAHNDKVFDLNLILRNEIAAAIRKED